MATTGNGEEKKLPAPEKDQDSAPKGENNDTGSGGRSTWKTALIVLGIVAAAIVLMIIGAYVIDKYTDAQVAKANNQAPAAVVDDKPAPADTSAQAQAAYDQLKAENEALKAEAAAAVAQQQQNSSTAAQASSQQQVAADPSQAAVQQTNSGAPQSAQMASALLGVPIDSLTPLGDPVRFGWVIGYPPYTRAFAASIPAGVCLDMAASTSKLSNPLVWQEDYSAQGLDWKRSLTAGAGQYNGLKATLFWSPCDHRVTTAQLPAPTPPPAPSQLPAPTPPPVASQLPSCTAPQVAGDWKPIESGCTFVATLATFSSYVVPQNVAIDYDGGGFAAKATEGQVLNYEGPATFRDLLHQQ